MRKKLEQKKKYQQEQIPVERASYFFFIKTKTKTKTKTKKKEKLICRTPVGIPYRNHVSFLKKENEEEKKKGITKLSYKARLKKRGKKNLRSKSSGHPLPLLTYTKSKANTKKINKKRRARSCCSFLYSFFFFFFFFLSPLSYSKGLHYPVLKNLCKVFFFFFVNLVTSTRQRTESFRK